MSASRSGRYRKILFEPSALQVFAPRLERAFAELTVRDGLTAPDLVSAGLLLMLACRRPDALQKRGRIEGPPRPPLPSTAQPASFTADDLHDHAQRHDLPSQAFAPFCGQGLTLAVLLRHTQWRGIPDAARSALLAWRDGQYPLQLHFGIPASDMVFDLQKQGQRCITFFLRAEEMSALHHERDALSFVVHDLMHAHAFYADPVRMRQQVGFYHWLDKARRVPALAERLSHSPAFSDSWEYIVSDMNSYCGHLLKTLHASIVSHSPPDLPSTHDTSTPHGIWSPIVHGSDLPSPIIEVFLRVNSPQWTTEDFLALESYCESLVTQA